MDALERLARERDLLAALLDLGAVHDVATLLDQALSLARELTGAQRGYLALYEGSDRDARWWTAAAFSDEEVDEVRRELSQGIVAAALDSGRPVRSASARSDPRFADRESVRRGAIEAVLAGPIGAGVGVIYLQGRAAGGAFSADDEALVATFGARLAPVARLVLRAQPRGADPTASYRARLRVEGVVGRSEALAAVLGRVALAAPLELDVLITGPTGSGKSQLAKVIADNSPRAGGPFVALNCAAIPESLFESELFGAVPGAFTGARQTLGKVAVARGGTLFLDELGAMPLGCQAKLLTLVQSREYWPLGERRPHRADVRILAATNDDLEQLVAERRFRADLLFRLGAFPIVMPGLAERPEDVGLLAEGFAVEGARRHHPTVRALPLSAGAQAALEAASWPGNVRQLAQVVTAGLILASGDGADAIEAWHLFPGKALSEAGSSRYEEAMFAFRGRLVARALERCGGNVTRAAGELGLSRSRLNELIGKHGLAGTGR